LLIAGLLLFAGSCARTIEKSRYALAMDKLEKGDYESAHEVFTEIAEREEADDLSTRVEFAIGLIKLLEMEDFPRMKECRDYFEDYSDRYPEGPHRENANRIVRLLNQHIMRAEREERTIKELTEQIEQQEKVNQTLQYQIQKLEEIHLDTERKRHLLE
jgi:outer membrane protein assembly factor BamD (BamD/ComL family)